MTLEDISVVVLAAEIIIMLLARFGAERRHWRHRKNGEAVLHKRDDIRLGPSLVYSVGALALVIKAVFSGTDFEWNIGTLSVLGVLGVLVPGYAAKSVMLLSTQGHNKPLKGWQEALACLLAALGGAAAAAFL
ncbi:hypothetical protein AB0D11_48400 [Streptomyces monashensis]|uniref:hypothetical protein n=1 Tax=Streptomyces monashensis TaxID=1678012 RepID=UPI00340373CB